MMDHNPKQLFDLLQIYRSEETKRARRNLSFIAFTVIASQCLGLSIGDVKPFGLDFSKSSSAIAIAIALTALVYWAFLFEMSHRHDKEMQNEKSTLLESRVSDLRSRKKKSDEQVQKRLPASPDIIEINAFLFAHERQLERTKKASKYGKAVENTEYYVPAIMFYIAVVILGTNLCAAL